MLIAWIICLVLSAGLFSVSFARDNVIVKRVAWLFFAAVALYTIVFSFATAGAWHVGILPAPLGVGIAISNLISTPEHGGSDIGIFAIIIAGTIFVTFITFALFGGFKAMANKKKAPERTPAQITTEAQSKKPSTGSGQHTGTNKRELDENQVYWVPRGEVYHSWDGCSSLRDSMDIYVGTVEEAEEAGKLRPCKLCCD